VAPLLTRMVYSPMATAFPQQLNKHGREQASQVVILKPQM
jgi:hypothetical protein